MQFKQLCYKNYDTCVDVMKEKMIYKDQKKYQAVNTLISAVKFEHGSPCWSRWWALEELQVLVFYFSASEGHC